MGIGLATALAFARQGARLVLTHKWGTADDQKLRELFKQESLSEPLVVEADVSNARETDALLDEIGQQCRKVDVFISNVSLSLLVSSVEDYRSRSLLKSIEYSACPFFCYPQKLFQRFGVYPRYIVGLSSGGPDHFYRNYDFAAASKAVMEVLCRYMNYRLFQHDVRINVVRSRLVRTASLRATFGKDFEEFAEQKFNMKDQFIRAEEVANAILGLCSGLMDGMSGQVLMVDRGTTFTDNLMGFFHQRQGLNFSSQ